MITMSMTKPNPATPHASRPSSELAPCFLDDLEQDLARRSRQGRMPAALGPAPYPVLEVYRSQDRVRVAAEVPGLTWRDIRVNLHENELILEGERRLDADAQQGVLRREGSYGRFCRWLPLDVQVIPAEMKVRLRDGILHLEVPIAFAESTSAS
jgi:HSP20 family molecular chaperone IbpA